MSTSRPAALNPPAKARTETDSMGAVDVPADKYWGAQTQRSLENFRIGTERMPLPVVRALGVQKMASALANMELGLLDAKLVTALTPVVGYDNAARIAGKAHRDGAHRVGFRAGLASRAGRRGLTGAGWLVGMSCLLRPGPQPPRGPGARAANGTTRP